MKLSKFIPSFVLFVLVLSKANAQFDDEAIKATLNNYLEGGAVGDTARLNKAFHPFANLRNVKDGKVSDQPVKKFIASVPAGGAKWTSKIISYSYAGTAATAVTEEELPTFKFVDFLNLIKINGEWKIVSRVYSRIEKTESVTSYPSAGNSTFSSSKPTQAKKPAPAKPKPSDDGWE
jgi:hypothetical protein